MANENDVVRLKHLNSLTSVVHDIILHSGGSSQALPDNADFALYVPNDTSIIITGKQAPVLSLGSWSSADSVYSAPITYTGDGTLSTDIGTIANDILTVEDVDGNFNGVISASAGDDFSSTELNFNYNTETNIVDVLSDPLEFVLAGSSFAFNEDNVFSFGRDTVTFESYNYPLAINGDFDAHWFKTPTSYTDRHKIYKVSENTGFIYTQYGEVQHRLTFFNITPDGDFAQRSVASNAAGDVVICNPQFTPHYFPALCNNYATFTYYNIDPNATFQTVTISSAASSLSSKISTEYNTSTAKYKINNTFPNSAEILKGKPPVISYNGQDVTLAEGTTEVKQPIIHLGYGNNAETALTYSGLPNDSMSIYTIASANRATVNPWLTDDQNVLLGCFYNKAKTSTYIITYKPGTYSKTTYLEDAFTVWGFMFNQSTHNTATLIKSPKKLSEILDDIAI